MAVPWNAIQVVLISAVYAALVEGVMWVLFYRNSSYSRQMDQLEKIGKKLEVAQQESAADPASAPKKKALQRAEKDLRTFAISLQGSKFKIGFITAVSMIGGMWMINKRFSGAPVAKMPFVPPSLFTNLTHMGIPGDDMTEVSAAFFFATTGPLFRANMQKIMGSGPSRMATKYLNGVGVVNKKEQ